MTVILFLRAGFVLASLLIIAIFSSEPLACRFLAYGPRSIPSQKPPPSANTPRNASSDRVPSPSHSRIDKVLDHIATYRIPRSWFSHFYPYTVAASLFWAHQIVTGGTAFRYVASHTLSSSVEDSMNTDQAVLVWLLLVVQGCRRLIETLIFSKPTTSTLWILHWIVGIGFYTAVNVAIWIESIPSLMQDPVQNKTLTDLIRVTRSNIVAVFLFVFASQVQFFAHKHLASLPSSPDYRIPTDRLFARNLTPHYFAEYLIYVALASIAAPPGYFVNVTIACAAAFVLINLGVTAHMTREWYVERFGEEKIHGKYRMIPKIW